MPFNNRRIPCIIITIVLMNLYVFSCVARAKEYNSRNVVLVFTKEKEDSVDFSIKNLQTFDVTITFKFTEQQNMASDLRFPYTRTILKDEVFQFSVWAKDKSKPWQYQWDYHWTYGSTNAEHDEAYIYTRPYHKGETYKVIQGFNGRLSHFGDSKYALDWGMPEGTPVLAARDGEVVGTRDIYSEGGLDEKYKDYVNYVIIKHPDNTFGEYDHFKFTGVVVKVGQQVKVGELIGYSGNVGYSSAPHLHFFVYKAMDGYKRQSFPVRFHTSQGDGIILKEGKSYRR